jgi:hypothetical protein
MAGGHEHSKGLGCPPPLGDSIRRREVLRELPPQPGGEPRVELDRDPSKIASQQRARSRSLSTELARSPRQQAALSNLALSPSAASPADRPSGSPLSMPRSGSRSTPRSGTQVDQLAASRLSNHPVTNSAYRCAGPSVSRRAERKERYLARD